MLRKYGVATHVIIPIPKAGSDDLSATADWTPAAGDVKVSKDGGAVANITTLPTAVSGGVLWDFTISATEMQAKEVVVQIVDSATKVIKDQVFIISTYGNASAQIVSDLDGLALSSVLGTPAGASVSADIAAVKTDTAAIKTKTDNLPANTSTVLGTPAGASISADVAAVKTDTAAVKAKTDQLTFSGAMVEANLKKINAVTVVGNGGVTPWGP